MQKRRKLGLVIAIPTAIALGLIAWGGYWASQRVREAREAQAALVAFIAAIGAGRIEDAYRSAAPELRCRMSLHQFRGLGNYYGKLQPGFRADVTLRDGWPLLHSADIEVSTHYDQDIPHHAALLRLEQGWRVAWIDRKPATEVQSADRKCGERSMHIAMIRQPLRELIEGLERGDFDKLARRFPSTSGQTAETLAAYYSPLKPRLAALREALAAEPVFVPDPQAGDGERTLAGSIGLTPARFTFRAVWKLEGAWTLRRFDLNADPAAH